MNNITLYDANNRPIPKPHGSYAVSRVAGGLRGTLSNWLVERNNQYSVRNERETIASRAEDIAANDPHAASTIDSIATNVVGTGLTPQSRPNKKILGWSDEETRLFQAQAEWAFSIWSKEADAAGKLPFWAIQFLSIHSLLVKGEFFRIPVMKPSPDRTFSLALQCVDPLRIYTPSDKTENSKIKDGVRIGKHGEATEYFVANPEDGFINYDLPSSQFTRVKSKVGHRPGAFHVFLSKAEEQVRGVSVLAPGMKFFRDLSDYLDFELVGAIVASNFPVFIETIDPHGLAEGQDLKEEDKIRYQESQPGQILYGNLNEKPHILKSDRPGNSFTPFVERIIRAIAASVGMPYEVVAKDFSKTNYSSARAALLEACRVFVVYQKWLVDMFCQLVWEMVLEEAWLRGMIVLPKGSPDWYDARHAYTRADWIPPRRGHVDPVKEFKAYIEAKNNNILPLSTIIAEMGGVGDWEAVLEQRSREVRMEKDLEITPTEKNNPTESSGVDPDEKDTDKEGEGEDDS